MFRSIFFVLLVTLALVSARSLEELNEDGEIFVQKRAADSASEQGDEGARAAPSRSKVAGGKVPNVWDSRFRYGV